MRMQYLIPVEFFGKKTKKQTNSVPSKEVDNGVVKNDVDLEVLPYESLRVLASLPPPAMVPRRDRVAQATVAW